MPTGIYLGGYPSNKFAFPRSYLKQFCIIATSGDVEQSDDQFTVWFDRLIGYGVTFILQPNILPWNSNRYTLDYFVYDLWWHAFFDGVHHPDSYTAAMTWRGTPKRPTLSITLSSGGTVETFFPLLPAPSDYWLPDFA